MTFIANASGDAARAYRRRVIITTSIGNALEWLDFAAYGWLAGIMTPLFFPALDPIALLLLSSATFAAPFLARPLGAVVMGAYADRRGRKPALIATLALMTLGTLIMAALPTYASIGAWAALLMLVARLLQSFSIGGEFGAVIAFVVEQGPKQRGFLASWHYASQSAALMLATGLGGALNAALTPAQLEAWGWRVPYLLGLMIGPLGYYMQGHLRESAEFIAAPAIRAPIRRVFAGYKPQLVLCGGAIVVATITTTTLLLMPAFAIGRLGVSPWVAWLGSLLVGGIQLVLVPVVGWLSDRIGRTMLPLIASLAILLLIYPMFVWMLAVPAPSTFMMVEAALGLLCAVYLGCLGGLISQLFPTRVLTSGLSMGNALAQAIFGGTAPLISRWLVDITGNPAAPSFYLMAGAAISIATLIAVRRFEFR